MLYQVQHFVELIEQSKLESPINSFQLSRDVMSVVDQARKKMGIIYPTDNYPKSDNLLIN